MKPIVALIAALGITTTSFAFDFQKSAIDMVKSARASKPVKTASSIDTSKNCADLEGTWEGECSNIDGKVEKSKMKIKQSYCVNLKIINLPEGNEDSFEMNIDMTGIGISSVHSSSVFASIHASYAGSWNVDKTTAQIEFAGLVASSFLGSPKSITGSMQIVRQGDQLIQFVKTEGFGEDMGDKTCRYNKIK